MSKRSATSVAAAAVAALIAAAAYVWHSRAPSPLQQWAAVGRYCTECHNRDDFTADIAFDRMSPDSVAAEPKLFERAVRKLRGNLMPPPGHPQPSAAATRSLLRWLETSLDAAGAATPNPGSVALHRLNRSEYANAIEDLFGLPIEVSALLPRDDESDGFDNVANVLKVSPSFLEQYISAARIVSEEAVGDAHAKLDARVYYPQPGTKQSVHVDGMPPGEAHGSDVDDQGNGIIEEFRLYQLVRQPGAVSDRTFEVTFLDPGASAYVFTFG